MRFRITSSIIIMCTRRTEKRLENLSGASYSKMRAKLDSSFCLQRKCVQHVWSVLYVRPSTKPTRNSNNNSKSRHIALAIRTCRCCVAGFFMQQRQSSVHSMFVQHYFVRRDRAMRCQQSTSISKWNNFWFLQKTIRNTLITVAERLNDTFNDQSLSIFLVPQLQL